MSERNEKLVSSLTASGNRTLCRGNTFNPGVSGSKLWRRLGTAVLGGAILIAGPEISGRSVLHADGPFSIVSDLLGGGSDYDVATDDGVDQGTIAQDDSIVVDDGNQGNIIDQSYDSGGGGDIQSMDQSSGSSGGSRGSQTGGTAGSTGGSVSSGSSAATQSRTSNANNSKPSASQPVVVTLYDGRRYTLPNLAAAQAYVNLVNANPKWRASIGNVIPKIPVLTTSNSTYVVPKTAPQQTPSNRVVTPANHTVVTSVPTQQAKPINHVPQTVHTYHTPQQAQSVPQQTYRVNQQTNYVPQQTYHAPQQVYHQPQQSYHAPQQMNSYRQPTQSYRAPSNYSGFRGFRR